MIVVGRNQTEKDRAELLTMVHRHGITDVLLMLADIWEEHPTQTARGRQLHAILVKAREEAMKPASEFSKEFEERLTWKPGDLVMLDPETLEPIDTTDIPEAGEEFFKKAKLYDRAAVERGEDKVAEALHEAVAKFSVPD